MLIRAHDCYSLCCSVDGIGEVLKVARDITTSLYQGKHYKLMVMDGWIDGWIDEWMDGWKDGWIDEWMDGWIDGWIDEWMDR